MLLYRNTFFGRAIQRLYEKVQIPIKEERNRIPILPAGIDHSMDGAFVSPTSPSFQHIADIDDVGPLLRWDVYPLIMSRSLYL